MHFPRKLLILGRTLHLNLAFILHLLLFSVDNVTSLVMLLFLFHRNFVDVLKIVFFSALSLVHMLRDAQLIVWHLGLSVFVRG